MPFNDEHTEWVDEIPSLFDLNGQGGMPGFTYLYCDSAHEHEAQQAGWKRIGPVLTLNGQPFVVMLVGERAYSQNPSRSASPLYISKYLLEQAGMAEPGELTGYRPTSVEPAAELQPVVAVEDAPTIASGGELPAAGSLG